MNIYVGNFPYSTTETELREAFQNFGLVDSVMIIKDRFSGRSKGFGFVQMPDVNEAEAAMKSLDGQQFGGRRINVRESLPRTNIGSRNYAGRAPERRV